MGKTSSIVKDRYNKKTYDEIKIRVSKGEKEKIQSHATTIGESVNSFVNRAIDEAMQHDMSTTDTSPTKKEGPSIMEEPEVIVRKTEDDLTEEIPTLLKTIRDDQKTSSKNTLPQKVAEKIITDKMNNLRSESRMDEYNVLINLLTIAPTCKADFMEEVKKANFMSDVDEAITALIIFHGLRDGE